MRRKAHLRQAEEARNGGADLDILDTRAATHARLGQQEPALADARRMLILDKTYVPVSHVSCLLVCAMS